MAANRSPHKTSNPDVGHYGTHEPLAQVCDLTTAEGESQQQIHYFHCDQIGIPREIRLDRMGNNSFIPKEALIVPTLPDIT